jgi:hypothetical protein
MRYQGGLPNQPLDKVDSKRNLRSLTGAVYFPTGRSILHPKIFNCVYAKGQFEYGGNRARIPIFPSVCTIP